MVDACDHQGEPWCQICGAYQNSLGEWETSGRQSETTGSLRKYRFRWSVSGTTLIEAPDVEAAQDEFDCMSNAEIAERDGELSHLSVEEVDRA